MQEEGIIDMKYELVIFDLDGTILDTLEDLKNSTNYALTKSFYEVRTMDEVRSFVGNGIGKLIERAVPENSSEEEVSKVLADFTEHYASHCADNTKPYDGIIEVITEIRNRGYKTAVVSNKADFAVQDLCNKYFPGLFDFVVGERENIKRKPAPDSVKEVLKELDVKRKKAIYVGDSEVDIMTAKNAHISGISVTWGFRERNMLQVWGAQLIVDKPVEILEYI